MIYLLPHIYFHLHLQKNNCRFSKDSPADSIITGTQSYSLIILTAIKTRQRRERERVGEKKIRKEFDDCDNDNNDDDDEEEKDKQEDLGEDERYIYGK